LVGHLAYQGYRARRDTPHCHEALTDPPKIRMRTFSWDEIRPVRAPHCDLLFWAIRGVCDAGQIVVNHANEPTSLGMQEEVTAGQSVEGELGSRLHPPSVDHVYRNQW